MPKAALLVLLLICTQLVFAQHAQIKGVVKTSDSKPAEGVTVSIKGLNRGTVTNKDGEFLIKNLNAGSYTVIASSIGLGTQEKSVSVTTAETQTINFDLLENASDLEQVIVSSYNNKYNEKMGSASLRVATPLQELPQNVQIVSKEMLKDQQVISMSDGLIRNVSGLVRMEHWGDLYTNISARGSQIQAFRNGFNVVSSYWGPLTEDMSFVDHVEFVKGPAGFMLSSGDPAGMYNVVTKKPTGETKGEVTFTGGSFNLYRTTLDLDGKLSKDGKLLYRLNLAAQSKGSFRANEYNDRYVIAPVLSYQLDEKTKLTLEYNYQRANMSNVGSFYVFAPDGYATLPRNFTSLPAGIEGTKIDDHSVYLTLQHDIASNWKFTTQVSRFDYLQTGSSAWPSTVTEDYKMIRGISIWDARSKMLLGQAFVNGEVYTGGFRHRILGGIDAGTKDYMADWGQSHALDLPGQEFDMRNPNLNNLPNGFPAFDRSLPLRQRATAGGGLMNQKYASVYVQDEIGFIDNKVRLTLAGRYTNLEMGVYGTASKADHFTPRAGLSVSLDKNSSVYALYDQAFLPQSGILANGAQVQPITGNNMEVGIKRDWFDGRWSSTLSVYRILKNNELTADPFSPPTSGLSIELGQKTAQGVEFDLRGTLASGLNLVMNYAFTESRVTKVADGVTAVKEGEIVPGYATHTANGWLTYKLQSGPLRGLGFNAGITFLGKRNTYWEFAPEGGAELPDYTKVDAGISYTRNRINVGLNVFNVLDRYLYSGSWYGWLNSYYHQAEAPRNLRLSLGYRF